MWRFIKTVLFGGIIFLLPAAILTILFNVFSETYNLIKEPLDPLAALCPFQTIGGVGIAALMAVALIIFGCFLTGLVIRTAWAQRILERVDSYSLVNVPFYAFFRSLFFEMAGRQYESGLDYVLAWIEECWQPAVVMEELENGWLVVFVPRVPNVFSGTLCYMPPDRVKRIETTSVAILKAMARFGVGSRALLKGQL
jgi:uncharacterized membrane protein